MFFCRMIVLMTPFCCNYHCPSPDHDYNSRHRYHLWPQVWLRNPYEMLQRAVDRKEEELPHIICMNDAKQPGVSRDVIATGFLYLRSCEGKNKIQMFQDYTY